MRRRARDTGKVALPLTFVLVCWGIAGRPQAVADEPREARFPKVTLQRSDQAANAVINSSALDFYNGFVKGKTVIISFF